MNRFFGFAVTVLISVPILYWVSGIWGVGWKERHMTQILESVGVKNEQSIKVVFSKYEEFLFMNDYSASYCFDLDGVQLSAEVTNWTLKNTDNERDSIIRKRAFTSNFNQPICVEKNSGNYEDIKMLVLDARWSKSQLVGWEVLFFDPSSNRLLFSGSQI